MKHPGEHTIHGLLVDGARRWAGRELVVFADGGRWTWAHALDEATAAASALARHGVGRDDRVLLLLPNGADWLRAWWGATLLGAVSVPVNPELRGQLLADVLDRTGPAAVVAGGAAAGRATEAGGRLVDPGTLREPGGPVPELDPPPLPSDPHCLLMTSGTTGPSKASITTNTFLCRFGDWLVTGCGVGPDDVFQADMPWFHLSAFAPVVQMLRVGGRIAVPEGPALTRYWATARDLGSTFAIAPGTVAQFLEAQPPRETDRDHRMRFIVCSPLPADVDGFVARFGLQGMCTAYGSTESGVPLVQTLGTEARPGTCGRVRDGYQLRLVDEYDRPVPPGEVGELVLRTDRPWELSQGYFGDPEATVRAFRNGWFHTGDAMRVDADGYHRFHDRRKDALRRRGENISSFEVEREVLAHPGVAEAACVAAPGDLPGDDEVKVFLVAALDTVLEPAELLVFLAGRMPHHMVPRYLEVVDELPKTPSLRVRKHVLRERGHGPATWDREAAGYRVTRAGLVPPA